MINVSQPSSVFPRLGDISMGLLVLEVGVLLIMSVLGVLGNVCLCVMVYKTRQLQTVSNYLIVHLALTDLLRIFTTISVSVIVIVKRTWVFGEVFCSVNGCYTLIFLVTSLMSVTLISINRYYLVVRPNQSKSVFSKRKTALMLGLLWILATTSGVPPNLGWGEYGFFTSRATCFIALGSSYSYTSVLVVAFIAFPFSVMIFCYLKVYLAIKKSKQRVVENGLKSLAAPATSSISNAVNIGKEVRENLHVSFYEFQTKTRRLINVRGQDKYFS